MKERPILMSAPMVRAILAGTKTQTRRAIKTHRNDHSFVCVDHGAGWWPYRSQDGESDVMSDGCEYPYTCPYGVPGDRLWVRETCRAHELPQGLDGVLYEADGAFRPIENSREAADLWISLNAYRGQRGAIVPAIHMPRWASRIRLEVTDVRVERLQEISEEDAKAEGAPSADLASGRECVFPHQGTHRWGFRLLWESINGSDSWRANPWVWVVAFHRVQP